MIALKRQIWADSLKGLLILLVVLGHAIQGIYLDSADANHIYNLIYSFHMPAFFAISGYFVKSGWRGAEIIKASISTSCSIFCLGIVKVGDNSKFKHSLIVGNHYRTNIFLVFVGAVLGFYYISRFFIPAWA